MKKSTFFCLVLIVMMSITLPKSYGQFTATIGNATAPDYCPFYGGYNYNYEINLYLATELGNKSGKITELKWHHYNTGVAQTVTNTKIYLKETDHNAVPYAPWNIFAENATLVYNTNTDGNIIGTGNNWSSVTLSSPFPYSGTKNLYVLMEITKSEYISHWYYTPSNNMHGRIIGEGATPPTDDSRINEYRADIQVISTDPLPVELTTFTASSTSNGSK